MSRWWIYPDGTIVPLIAGGVDNTVLNTGTGGDTIASDDIAGVKYQRVKLVEGADNVNDGDIAATNPLPVETPSRTASDTLTAAGFSTAVSLLGLQGAAMRLTFGGTITTLDVRAQVSVDGGTNFQDVDTYNISSEVVQLVITSATAADYSIYVPGGASHVRANVVTLTGTTPSITIAMRGTYMGDGRTHTAADRVPGSSDPAHILALGASDGTNLQRLRTATAAPAGAEQGLIVRNIPSGSQTVAQATATSLKAEVVGPTADNAANPTAKLAVLAGVANAAAPTRTEGNVNPLRLNLAGDAAITLDGEAVVLGAGAATIGALTANQSVNEAQYGGTAVVTGGVAGLPGAGGPAARGVALSGNPLLNGGRAHVAIGTAPAAVGADGQAVDAWLDDVGRSVVVKGAPSRVAVDTAGTAQGPKTTTLTLTTDAALVAAPGVGKSTYVTSISASNTSATLTRVDIKDGTTIRVSMALAASGGGFVQAFDPPWKITANTALNGALGTAVTDVRVNVHYYQAA